MDKKEEIEYSFKGGLRIVENTLSGKGVPFKIKKIYHQESTGIIAQIVIDGEIFIIAPNTSGNKLWIVDFPIDNSKEHGVPPGYIGFPTEVAGVIDKYYKEKPKGPLQKIDGIGTISLNEVIKEEVAKVFEDDYDYAGEEREYHDREDYERHIEKIEAEVSSGLGFMQDTKSSVNKLEGQMNLKMTNSEIDMHIKEAIEHINQAIKLYLKNMSPDAKSEMINRVGEVNIDK